MSAILLVASCGQPSISGQYVFADDDEAVLLQLVETPDKKLSGQFDITTLNDKGKIESRQMQVEGATGGNIVTLTTKPSSFFDGKIGFTGKVEGSKISFTSSGASFEVTKQNSKVYQKAVSALEDTSKAQLQKIALAKEQEEKQRQTANYVAQLNDMSMRLREETKAVSQHIEAVKKADAAYPAISAKMSQILQAKRTEPDSYKRNQMDYQLNQGTYSTNQVTWQFENSADFAEDQTAKYVAKVAPAIESCLSVPLEIAELRSACDNLNASAPPFKARIDELLGLVKKTKATYEAESARQKAIITEADKIED